MTCKLFWPTFSCFIFSKYCLGVNNCRFFLPGTCSCQRREKNEKYQPSESWNLYFEVLCGTNQKSKFLMHLNFFITYSKNEKKRKLASGTIIGKRRTCRHSNYGIKEHVCLYSESSMVQRRNSNSNWRTTLAKFQHWPPNCTTQFSDARTGKRWNQYFCQRLRIHRKTC